MNHNENDVILTGNKINVSESTRQTVLDKTSRLFAHENHIIRLRLELEHDANVSKEKSYCAKGQIAIKGPDLIATASADDLLKSVDLLVEKLDRMLRRRSRLRRVKRKHARNVEIPAAIPKMAPT
jgi:putative sigma-54 modulation protein